MLFEQVKDIRTERTGVTLIINEFPLQRDPGKLLKVENDKLIFEEGTLTGRTSRLEPLIPIDYMMNRGGDRFRFRHIVALTDGRICEAAVFPRKGSHHGDYERGLFLGAPGENLQKLSYLNDELNTPNFFFASEFPSRVVLGNLSSHTSILKISVINIDSQREEKIIFQGLTNSGLERFNVAHGVLLDWELAHYGGGRTGCLFNIRLRRISEEVQLIPFGNGSLAEHPSIIFINNDYVVFWEWRNANFIMLDLTTWPVTEKYRFSLWDLRTEKKQSIVAGCQLSQDAFAFLDSAGMLILVREFECGIDVTRFQLSTKEKWLENEVAGQIAVDTSTRILYIKFGLLYQVSLDRLLR